MFKSAALCVFVLFLDSFYFYLCIFFLLCWWILETGFAELVCDFALFKQIHRVFDKFFFVFLFFFFFSFSFFSLCFSFFGDIRGLTRCFWSSSLSVLLSRANSSELIVIERDFFFFPFFSLFFSAFFLFFFFIFSGLH